MLALQTPDGYVVDYGMVSNSFVEAARAWDGVDVSTGTEVRDIRETADGFTIDTEGGPHRGRRDGRRRQLPQPPDRPGDGLR